MSKRPLYFFTNWTSLIEPIQPTKRIDETRGNVVKSQVLLDQIHVFASCLQIHQFDELFC